MKKLLLVVLALMLALTVCACGQKTTDDDWTYIEEKGTVVIGITEYQPMNYYDESGKLVGFDTEFAEAVCESLGLTPEFIVIDWDQKVVELDAKNIDCIWNGMTVRDDLKEQLSFSQSYMTNKQVIVIRAEDAATYTDTASLSGASIVAEAGSAGEAAIAANEDLATATYTPVTAMATALLEVKAGTADAAVVDSVMAEAMVGEGTDYSELMFIEGVVLENEEYAIGFRTDSTALDKFNEAIDALQEDGTIDAIAEKYGLTLSLVK